MDRRGTAITFKYDVLDRRTGIVYGAESSVRLFYDTVGRVTNVTDSVGVQNKFTYDTLNRLVKETNTYSLAAAEVNYGYNDVGLRTNMTVSGQTPVQYLYDAANRLTNVVQGTLTASLTYDDAGRRTKLVFPNGINVLYSYDKASRLTNITYQAAVTNRIDYRYDDVGNRVGRASSLSTYNLPSAVGNSQYDDANHQLTFGSYSLLFDANGNVTNIFNGSNGSTNRLVWNARNQLSSISGPASATFVYDSLGRRVQRSGGGVTEYTTYDGLDAIMRRAGLARFIYFRGLGIDEPWLQTRLKTGAGASTNNFVYTRVE